MGFVSNLTVPLGKFSAKDTHDDLYRMTKKVFSHLCRFLGFHFIG